MTDDYVLRDGEALRVSLTTGRDYLYRWKPRPAPALNAVALDDRVYLTPKQKTAAGDATVFDAAKHKPGFRIADQAARDASDKAYCTMVREMQDRWKSPQRRQAETEIACEIGRILAMGDA